MRLDVFLSDNGLVESRTDAKKFILGGFVSVNGKVISKPAFEVVGDEEIFVDKSSKKYVSRGGLKLEAALDEFSVDPSGRVAIDIGASSGGFTDCLLQRGAEKVYAVDSGVGQIAVHLRSDARVCVYENYNARYMESSHFEIQPTLAVMDVSFISATLIIPAVKSILGSGGDFICLIKPQFEVGKGGLGKGGIVKDASLRKKAVEKVLESASACGFDVIKVIESPIVGGSGNIEYLAHFISKDDSL